MAGVGNLYKTETCFLRGVSPWTLTADVPDPAGMIALARKLLLRNADRPEQTTTGELEPGASALGVRAGRAALPPLRHPHPRRRAGRRRVRAGGLLVPDVPAGPGAAPLHGRARPPARR